jgi:hypothetical protein
MNSATHEELAHDLIRLARLLCGSVGTDQVLSAFVSPGDRDDFATASSAPDRVRDIMIDLPGSPPSHVALNQNLSSLLHFCRADGRGYCWDDDLSLPFGAAQVVGLFGAPVLYDPERAGERSPGRGPHPMAAAVAGGATLGTFIFPSALEMIRYYVSSARVSWAGRDFSSWRRCMGFAWHYLVDLHVPHHAWGALRYGHQQWEDQAESHWLDHMAMMRLASDPTLFETELAPAVVREYEPRVSVNSLLAARPTFGAAHELSECGLSFALGTCHRALAAGLALLPLGVA